MLRIGFDTDRLRRHLGSDVLALVSGVVLAFAALCIVMHRTGAYEGAPWHAMGIAAGCSGALAMAAVCLRRGWENDRQN